MTPIAVVLASDTDSAIVPEDVTGEPLSTTRGAVTLTPTEVTVPAPISERTCAPVLVLIIPESYTKKALVSVVAPAKPLSVIVSDVKDFA